MVFTLTWLASGGLSARSLIGAAGSLVWEVETAVAVEIVGLAVDAC